MLPGWNSVLKTENVWPQRLKYLLSGPIQTKSVGLVLREINELAALVFFRWTWTKSLDTKLREFAERLHQAEELGC